MRRWLLVLAVAATLSADRAAANDTKEGIAFFEAKIRPVLVENCYQCHGPKKQRGDLRLDSKAAVMEGGENGAIFVPGKAEGSLLLKALRHQGPKMPPDTKLPASVVADFAKWIDMGAPDPRDGKPTPVAQGIDWKAARAFWAFVPPHMPPTPKVKNTAWVKSPIDAFVLSKMEEKKLHPVRPAGKRELLRRAYFDLIGLPPSPEEVETFLKDDSPKAYEKVLDQLLASPHYGERWGRYWLDVARYAEDQAHTFDVKPSTNAWRYRDWVVNSLNEDMPYDRFVKLQIAADVIEKDETSRLKHLPALGLFGLGAQYYKNTDAAKATADELDDRVDTLTRGLLGLTVSCARCHNHKFDPIPQQDYYSLAGVFHSSKLSNLTLAPKQAQDRFNALQAQMKKLQGETQALLSEARAGEIARYLTAAWKFQVQKQKDTKWSVGAQAKKDGLDAGALGRCVKYLEKPVAGLTELKKFGAAEEEKAVAVALAFERKVQGILAEQNKKPNQAKNKLLQDLFGDKAVFTLSEKEALGKLTEPQKQRLNQMKGELANLQKDEAAKPLPITHGLADVGSNNMKVFLRGDPAKLGEVAPRRFLKILAGDDPKPFTQGSGRLELAEAIASKDNPLTARVIVNRVWQYHFGRALVGTPSNFGELGDRPSHPELLDYLACRLMESGWSLKTLHKEIMLSAVYQLGSESDDKNFSTDADNRWLWRMNRRRLDIEAWRDSMLAVSGKLDPTLGGPTLDLSAGNNVRRTVYARISRHNLNGLLRLFDFPDANITSERRNETTVPQQQLFVINSPFVIDMSKALAARVHKDASTDAARVQRAFQLAYGRAAAAEEVRVSLEFLAGQDDPMEQPMNRLTRWERLAQVLLGSNEFMYID